MTLRERSTGRLSVAGPSISRPRWPMRWRRRTPGASSTATSSRRTCSSCRERLGQDPRLRPGEATAGPRPVGSARMTVTGTLPNMVLGRPPTCPRSRRAATPPITAPTFSPSAASSTRCSRDRGRSTDFGGRRHQLDTQGFAAAAADSVERAIPPALDSIVQRCLAKDPRARFQSASDLAFALEERVSARIGQACRRRPGAVDAAANGRGDRLDDRRGAGLAAVAALTASPAHGRARGCGRRRGPSNSSIPPPSDDGRSRRCRCRASSRRRRKWACRPTAARWPSSRATRPPEAAVDRALDSCRRGSSTGPKA